MIELFIIVIITESIVVGTHIITIVNVHTAYLSTDDDEWENVFSSLSIMTLVAILVAFLPLVNLLALSKVSKDMNDVMSTK